ncbi:HupE/UreJ family protein [Brachymonas sp.]|uniref:HupE/UreJ family protein n=1 Tax=Brachymonas sp. TaxID=1936292 RepID=UPI0035B26A4E
MHKRFLSALVLLGMSVGAQAHPGSAAHLHLVDGSTALLAGFLHPLTGADHLLAMGALGLWCGLMLRRQWLPPLAFAGSMAAGLALTQTALRLPAVEPMVAASLLVFGLLLVARRGMSLAWAMGLAAVFAVFHGYAHGEVFPSVLPAGVFSGYMMGMVAASLLLHAAGVASGLWLRRRAPAPWQVWGARFAGVVTLGYGAVVLGA